MSTEETLPPDLRIEATCKAGVWHVSERRTGLAADCPAVKGQGFAPAARAIHGAASEQAKALADVQPAYLVVEGRRRLALLRALVDALSCCVVPGE